MCLFVSYIPCFFFLQKCDYYRMGGIIPPVARDLHKQHIESVVDMAMKQSGLAYEVNTDDFI